MVSVKIMPTERSMPAVSTTSVCAMATSASSIALLAAVLTTLATEVVVKPWPDAGWLHDVDGEHHHEDAEREQRAPLLREPEAPVLHAFTAGRAAGLPGAEC